MQTFVLKRNFEEKNRMHGKWHLVYAMEENSPFKYIFGNKMGML